MVKTIKVFDSYCITNMQGHWKSL